MRWCIKTCYLQACGHQLARISKGNTQQETPDAIFLNQGGTQGIASNEARLLSITAQIRAHNPAATYSHVTRYSAPGITERGQTHAPALCFSGVQLHGCRAVGPKCCSLLRIVLLTAVAI